MMRTDPVLCEITGSKSNLKCNQLVLVCRDNLTSDLPVGLKINQSSWSTSIYLFRIKEEMRSWFRPSLLSFQVSGVFFFFTALDPLAAQHWIWSQDPSAVGLYHFWHSCSDQEQTSPAQVNSLLQVTDTHGDLSVSFDFLCHSPPACVSRPARVELLFFNRGCSASSPLCSNRPHVCLCKD